MEPKHLIRLASWLEFELLECHPNFQPFKPELAPNRKSKGWTLEMFKFS
jgi:hypothetical protein